MFYGKIRDFTLNWVWVLPEGKHCAPPGFTSCVFALIALQILQRCPISWKTSKSGSNIMLPFEENKHHVILMRISCKILLCFIRRHWQWCDPHHISNDVVVPVLRSIDSQDAKHNKNHRPGVDQRTHCWVAACTATARVKAKRFGWFCFSSRRGIFENRTTGKSLSRRLFIQYKNMCTTAGLWKNPPVGSDSATLRSYIWKNCYITAFSLFWRLSMRVNGIKKRFQQCDTYNEETVDGLTNPLRLYWMSSFYIWSFYRRFQSGFECLSSNKILNLNYFL